MYAQMVIPGPRSNLYVIDKRGEELMNIRYPNLPFIQKSMGNNLNEQFEYFYWYLLSVATYFCRKFRYGRAHYTGSGSPNIQ